MTLDRPTGQLLPGAVLTVTEAARELGGRRADVVKWLRRMRLVRHSPGLGERVLWSDVLDELRMGRAPQDAEASPVKLERAGVVPRRRG